VTKLVTVSRKIAKIFAFLGKKRCRQGHTGKRQQH